MFQGFSDEKFRNKKAPLSVLAYFVNGANVGVVERGCGACFAQEPVHSFRVAASLRQQKLQRHMTAEQQILCFVYLADAAAANLPQHAVVSNRCSNHVARSKAA